jgi:hypothetical protein
MYGEMRAGFAQGIPSVAGIALNLHDFFSGLVDSSTGILTTFFTTDSGTSSALHQGQNLNDLPL